MTSNETPCDQSLQGCHPVHLWAELGLTLIPTQGIGRGTFLLHVTEIEGASSKIIVLPTCRHTG